MVEEGIMVEEEGGCVDWRATVNGVAKSQTRLCG